jgi:hypothetical protein
MKTDNKTCWKFDNSVEHHGHYWPEFDNARWAEWWCIGFPSLEVERQPAVRRGERIHGEICGPSPYLEIMQDAWARFVVAYTEYGDSSKEETGLAGQWADLYRKIMKLKAPLWAGEKGRLTRENEKDILCDLIGHSLLALEMLQRGAEGGR